MLLGQLHHGSLGAVFGCVVVAGGVRLSLRLLSWLLGGFFGVDGGEVECRFDFLLGGADDLDLGCGRVYSQLVLAQFA